MLQTRGSGSGGAPDMTPFGPPFGGSDTGDPTPRHLVSTCTRIPPVCPFGSGTQDNGIQCVARDDTNMTMSSPEGSEIGHFRGTPPESDPKMVHFRPLFEGWIDPVTSGDHRCTPTTSPVSPKGHYRGIRGHVHTRCYQVFTGCQDPI